MRSQARRRPQRKPRIPRRAARFARSPQPPRAVEHFLVAALSRVNARISRAMAAVLYPHVASFAKVDEKTDAVRLDAPPPPPPDGDVGATIKAVRAAVEQALEEGDDDIASAAETAAKRTLRHSRAEFSRLRINVKKEPSLKWLINGWAKDIAGRVKGATDDQIDKIARILDEGYGMRAETLAKEIARQVEDVTASRAEFVARDAVLTLHSKITHERQRAAGITRGVWSTSGDERVRESHAEMDGVEFELDDPPIVDGEPTRPGEAPLCRCVTFPVLPELDDEEA